MKQIGFPFLLEGLRGGMIIHIFAFANRPMAERIAVGRLSSFICQKYALPTGLLLFGRAQQTSLVRFLRCGCIRPMSRKIKCICEIMNLQYMKRFYLSLMFAVVCVLGLEAQTQAELRTQFAQTIQTYLKDLPKEYRDVTITRAEVTDGEFVIFLDMSDDQVGDFEEFKKLISLYKGNFVKTLYEEKDAKVALFAKTGLNLKLNIRVMPSKKEIVLTMTAAEFAKLAKVLPVGADRLPSIVEEMRKTLPQEWEDGLSLTDLYLEKDNLVYKIKTDESDLTMDLLHMLEGKEGADIIKGAVLKEIIVTDDEELSTFVNSLVEAHLGLKLVFWSEQSVKRVTFAITPEEIERQVNATR